MVLSELSLAKYIVVHNVMTAQALKTPRVDASETGEAWSTNHLEILVSTCRVLNSASHPSSYIKTVSPQCNATGRWALWEVIRIK